MRLIWKIFGRSRCWSRALALMLLALFLGTTLAAAAPSLHAALHSDANNPDHHCAITLLIQGQVDVPVFDKPICLVEQSCSDATPFLLSVFSSSVEVLAYVLASTSIIS